MFCSCVFIRFVHRGYVTLDAYPWFFFILEYLHVNRSLLSDSTSLLTNVLLCTVSFDMHKLLI